MGLMIAYLILGCVTVGFVGVLFLIARFYDHELTKAGTAHYNTASELANTRANLLDAKDDVETYKRLAESEKLNHELCHKEPWGSRTCDIKSTYERSRVRPETPKKKK